MNAKRKAHLRLVPPPAPRERLIIATLVRRHRALWTRRYARIDTAIRRCSQLAVFDLEPGDVIEFAHAVTGLQIGTIRVNIGKLTATWIWDEKK